MNSPTSTPSVEAADSSQRVATLCLDPAHGRPISRMQPPPAHMECVVEFPADRLKLLIGLADEVENLALTITRRNLATTRWQLNVIGGVQRALATDRTYTVEQATSDLRERGISVGEAVH